MIEIIELVGKILALLVAIIGHEIMHGYIAYKYGDKTAKYMGRLTINPIPHIDLVGSIILPLTLFLFNSPFLFGWAKPVPINLSTVIRNGGLSGAIGVALAGVSFNLILALFASTLVSGMDLPESYLGAFFYYFLLQLVIINVILAVFNLWPVPKFDGANALIYFSLLLGFRGVRDFYMKIENFSLVILLVIFLIPPLQSLLFSPAIWIVENLLK